MAKASPGRLPWLLSAGLWGISLLLALQTIARHDGLINGLSLLTSAGNGDVSALILRSMWAPRQCMAMLAGATLGLCGWLMQRALRNPLAEPVTLGMTAGATLAMGVASLWFPMALAVDRTGVVILGELAALIGAMLLSWRHRLSPLVMIQAGMLINLWCGSLTLLIAITHDQFLLTLLMWGGGSLAQQDWHVFERLLPWLGGCLVGVLLVLRQLDLLQLPETMVSSLGASPWRIRAAAILLALVMSALIINAVGVIGFVGLAAPHLADLAGARTSRQRVLHSALMGAGLLWFTDLCAAHVAMFNGQLLPVGMLTALTGGPLLIMLAARTRQRTIETAPKPTLFMISPARRVLWVSAITLGVAVIVSLFLGHGLYGWHWANLREFSDLLPLRLPRMLAAVSAGAMLAGSGVLLQRVSGNPLASPEVLGIGGGAAMGVTAFVILFPAGGSGMLALGSVSGALLSLSLTLWSSRRSAFNPQRVLLNGLALNALCQAVTSIVMLNNIKVSGLLLPLMTGNTYNVSDVMARTAFGVALVMLALVPLFCRWLRLLPMGSVAGSLGVAVPRARFGVMGLAALMTGLATLLVGPVSFVGLLGPHLARRAGVKGPLAQLFTAALFSALIMTAADWLGRNALYPRQLPVGLVASLVGVPLLIRPLIRGKKHT